MVDIIQDFSIKKLNTFGIDGKAIFYAQVSDIESLVTILTNEKWSETPKLILGGGSNILLTRDYPGLVVHMSILGKQIVKENEDHVWVKTGAGENWHEFVLYCLENGFGGIENLSLIPGTVGAAPMQNIGAYGVEVESVFESLEAVNRENGNVEIFSHSDCKFGYRQSVFKNTHKDRFVISYVTFKLSKKHHLNTTYGAIKQTLAERKIDSPTINDVSDVVISIRKSKLPDPSVIGNAGSFFKNPVVDNDQFKKLCSEYPEMPYYKLSDHAYKIPAAWLIEQAGWKGKRRGNIGVHDKQALVLVNHGEGQGQDLVDLAYEIRDSIQEKFDVLLDPEVNIV